MFFLLRQALFADSLQKIFPRRKTPPFFCRPNLVHWLKAA